MTTMNEIVRLYLYENGREVCVKEPEQMFNLLANATEEIDLDYHDHRGHAKAASSRDLIGKTVKIGDLELEIPKH
jgi:hypothetical protein